MKKFLLLVLGVILGVSRSLGQNSLPEFVPPTTDTYRLVKHADIPVSYYTGTPEIDVPIWIIKMEIFHCLFHSSRQYVESCNTGCPLVEKPQPERGSIHGRA